MSFRDLYLKEGYNSFEEDLLDDFYVPVLSHAIEYDRLSGFFSSTALAVAAKGIYEFLRSNGHMRLVVGSRLSEDDVNAIVKGEKERETVLAEAWERELELFPDDVARSNVRALAWLVAHDRLDVRIASVLDEDGLPVTGPATEALFHVKVGVLRDRDGNTITFSGSINETAAGWIRNYEEFKVFRDWFAGDRKCVTLDTERFERVWSGQYPYLQVEPVPEAVRLKLISMAPRDLDELQSIKRPIRLQLREYQADAVNAWFANNCRGIFAMATGTGKTIAALGCIRRLMRTASPLAVVITVPTVHLIDQWKRHLERHDFKFVIAWGSASRWRDSVANALMDLEIGVSRNVVILVTDSTFHRESFTSLFGGRHIDVLLIGDEAHGLGSPIRMTGLLAGYQYRLGLTATPKRHFDEEGTKTVMEYFGGVVFEFDLSRAIEAGYLCPYEYNIHFVGLSPEEKRKYVELTRKVAQAYYASKTDVEKKRAFEHFSIERRKVVINADAKYTALTDIMQQFESPRHMLVYCSPQQIKRVQALLDTRKPPLLQSKFTAREDPELRQKLIKSFSSGNHQILVAMRCLDEGIDIPATKVAIFMASTTNPRQFIQRRGRILRTHPGKELAIVHDIVVIPSVDSAMNTYNLERSIVKSELDRCYEFAKHAINSDEAKAIIHEYAAQYEVEMSDVS